MCSRFSLAEDNDFLAARLGVSAMALANYRPRYNIAPQQEHFIVTTEYENRKLAPAKWRLVSNPGEHGRAKFRSMPKLKPWRAGQLSPKRSPTGVCVIPANGFYEWTGPKYARQPFWIHRGDGDLLLFAGLYQNGENNDHRIQATFTILTCAANSTLATIHNRMPVILSDREADDWMNLREKAPLSLTRLLVATAEDLLLVQPASPLVNSVRNEGLQLLAGCKIEQQLFSNF